MKDNDVIFKPNFNTADPPPASSSMETIRQLIIKLKEMGARSITVAERSGPANTAKTFEKKGLYSEEPFPRGRLGKNSSGFPV